MNISQPRFSGAFIYHDGYAGVRLFKRDWDPAVHAFADNIGTYLPREISTIMFRNDPATRTRTDSISFTCDLESSLKSHAVVREVNRNGKPQPFDKFLNRAWTEAVKFTQKCGLSLKDTPETSSIKRVVKSFQNSLSRRSS